VKAFRTPKTALGRLDAEAVAVLVASAADITLILDKAGTIRDVAIAASDLADELAGHARWYGRRWAEIVTPESAGKVELLLANAVSRQAPEWRHLNHPAVAGPDVPVLYVAVPGGVPGRVVAFGRDQRPVSSLQRRLVDAQQSMERDYARIRQAETRYQLLLQMAPDAVLLIDGTSLRVLESNPAARRLFGAAVEPRGPLAASRMFAGDSARSVEQLLAGVLASGRADDVRARIMADGDREVVVSASPFRDGSGSVCLLRVAAPLADPAGTVVPKLKTKLLKLLESAPDAFVVTGDDGRVVTANAAFLELVQLPNEERAHGEPLERWLGRAGIDLDILLAHLRQRGLVRLFATTLRGELGAPAEVEISGVKVMNGGRPCFGFAIRDVGRRLSAPAPGERVPARSFEYLTELIGRVSLKDLVRDATDVIERLCIEAALELTGDNRASAAEMLGLSRQSLYVKLRRYGLGDLAAEGAN
jgi:transcriptional regulator PpsR